MINVSNLNYTSLHFQMWILLDQDFQKWTLNYYTNNRTFCIFINNYKLDIFIRLISDEFCWCVRYITLVFYWSNFNKILLLMKRSHGQCISKVHFQKNYNIKLKVSIKYYNFFNNRSRHTMVLLNFFSKITAMPRFILSSEHFKVLLKVIWKTIWILMSPWLYYQEI